MSSEAKRISLNKRYTENGFADKVYHIHLRYTGDNDELYFRDTQTSFKSKLTKTNGTYTANVAVSKAQKYGGWAEVKFTYNDKTYELKTSLVSSAKG